MWRIANSFDFVAPTLPDWGDDLKMHFSFFHLGIELTTHRESSNKTVLSRNAMPHESPVSFEGTKSTEEGSVGECEIQEARKDYDAYALFVAWSTCVSMAPISSGFRQDAVSRKNHNKICFCVVCI
jgi:hypothetical protein